MFIALYFLLQKIQNQDMDPSGIVQRVKALQLTNGSLYNNLQLLVRAHDHSDTTTSVYILPTMEVSQ